MSARKSAGRKGSQRKRARTILTEKEIFDKVGEFLDEYLEYDNGKPLPRNVPMFRKAFNTILDLGIFSSVNEIRKTFLKEYQIILPNYLFE